MREAIGGSYLFGLALTFIILFASFIAVAINYTKAFRVKNEIISIIEESEGYTRDSMNVVSVGESAEAKIDEFLDTANYDKEVEVDCPDEDMKSSTSGYCYKLIQTADNEGYYKVTSFVVFELPLVDAFGFSFNIPVSGETKLIRNLPSAVIAEQGNR